MLFICIYLITFCAFIFLTMVVYVHFNKYIRPQNDSTFHDTDRISSCLRVFHCLRKLHQKPQRRQLSFSWNVSFSFSFSLLDFLQLLVELKYIGSLPLFQRNLTFLEQTCLGRCSLTWSFSSSTNQALRGRGFL